MASSNPTKLAISKLGVYSDFDYFKEAESLKDKQKTAEEIEKYTVDINVFHVFFS